MHLYYKTENNINIIRQKISIEQQKFIRALENPENYIDHLCNNIYNHGDEKMKIMTMLLQTYFLW